MGRFRRGKSDQSDAQAPDVQARESAYRRLGNALATVVVTLEGPPPAGARLRVSSGGTPMTADPLMATLERPGSRDEVHRLWFVAELSAVMFDDGDFVLLVGDSEVPLPRPTAQAGWTGDEEDGSATTAAALTESELRAAVASLEERCRVAESANAELTADSRRMSEAVAATLADVQREREELLDLVARTNAELDRAPDAAAPEGPGSAMPSHYPTQALLARLGAARGAASPD